MRSLFSSLNPKQEEAVRQVEGRLLILAGAGSGKTRVLTTRMAHLILEHKILPKQILGLTFTNKAAEEMRHRVSGLISSKMAKEIDLCTFHSFCMKVLREEIHHLGFTTDFSLYDAKDLERLVKGIARDILEHEGELFPSLGATMDAISKASQGQIRESKKDPSWHDQFAKEVHGRLKDALRAYNAVDFDHLLTLTVELFRDHPEVLAKYQERYRYIMIDEYQDTNQVQFQLAELLSSKYNNLCVVGDDDQAIYGWRGADVQNILGFDRAKKITLEQNYRSHNVILKAANAVISHNRARHEKVLWSDGLDEVPITVFVAPGEKEEAEAVTARMAYLKEKLGMPWREMAILYRSNALSRSFELALMKQRWKSPTGFQTGIPFEIFGGLEFYERREVKDLLAYLRVILNPLDQEALLRIINLPRRGIGDAALDKMTSYARKEGLSLWSVLQKAVSGMPPWSDELSVKTRDSLSRFMQILEEMKGLFKTGSLSETCRLLIEKVQFKKCIEEDVKSDKMRAFKWENVEEFVNALADYEQKSPNSASLHDFVSSMVLDIDADRFSSQKFGEDKVSLMTFHGAKGLEFDVCFLTGLEDHLIPHEKSLKESGIEEERRLMYVALTRAKKWLFLSMTKQRKRMGKEYPSRPSRFLFEIPQELLKSTLWHDVDILNKGQDI